jgi:hypothetical protein
VVSKSRIPVISPRTLHVRTGTVHVTPDNAKHWAANVAAFVQAGFTIPVAWGQQQAKTAEKINTDWSCRQIGIDGRISLRRVAQACRPVTPLGASLTQERS